ncbi:MAG: hypothetical protein FJW63_09065 [Actinobacteria bacterium]|nr:hypothetical protein [Actinomycetota bacterium]
MKVYYLGLKRQCVLKIDFVQDFEKNIKRIKNGIHSLEDIYCKKIFAGIGTVKKMDTTGRIIHAGRHSVKDLSLLFIRTSHGPVRIFL